LHGGDIIFSSLSLLLGLTYLLTSLNIGLLTLGRNI
jgi:hypothetical protein